MKGVDFLADSYNSCKSEEFLKRCKPFEQLKGKYLLLYEKYACLYEELVENIEDKACSRKYSKGGLTIHRGYYSPSFMDLVVSGCNRGHLLKKVPPSNKYDYEYIFNDKNQLICVKKMQEPMKIASVELFVYESTRIVSLVYEGVLEYNLTTISECQYENDMISRYELALCGYDVDCNKAICCEIDVEVPVYDDRYLHSILWSRYMPSMHLLNQEKYTFSRDAKGMLSTYTVESIDGFNMNGDVSNGKRSYKVLSKNREDYNNYLLYKKR